MNAIPHGDNTIPQYLPHAGNGYLTLGGNESGLNLPLAILDFCLRDGWKEHVETSSVMHAGL